MRKLLKAFLFLFIVGIGFAGYWYLYTTRSVPQRQKADERSTLVKVIETARADEPMSLTAMGTVIPARTVTIFPEVSGRIVYQSPRLIPGGRFKNGETILRIDPFDYDLAIRQQQARVVQARMELAREKGLKSVAEREWNLIRNEVQPTTEGRKLALREIQFENAKAALDAAEAALEQAKRMRERTVIRAPFEAVVSEELVDRGQVLFNTSRVATLVAADKFWVQVSVPVNRLGWILIPGINSQDGSQAEVIQEAAGRREIKRPGRVLKLESNLDPKGKMARLLVEVNDPMGKVGENGTTMPLLLGDYVKVRIQGPDTSNAIALPRRAVRDQSRVWVMNRDQRLEVREVETAWAREDTVFVSGDLRAGERVITSRIYAPISGMKLHTEDSRPEVEDPS